MGLEENCNLPRRLVSLLPQRWPANGHPRRHSILIVAFRFSSATRENKSGTSKGYSHLHASRRQVPHRTQLSAAVTLLWTVRSNSSSRRDEGFLVISMLQSVACIPPLLRIQMR